MRWRRRRRVPDHVHVMPRADPTIPFNLPPLPVHSWYDPPESVRHYTTVREFFDNGASVGWDFHCACGAGSKVLPTEEDALEAALAHWDAVDPL